MVWVDREYVCLGCRLVYKQQDPNPCPHPKFSPVEHFDGFLECDKCGAEIGVGVDVDERYQKEGLTRPIAD